MIPAPFFVIIFITIPFIFGLEFMLFSSYPFVPREFIVGSGNLLFAIGMLIFMKKNKDLFS